jgi:hypothetical protein
MMHGRANVIELLQSYHLNVLRDMVELLGVTLPSNERSAHVAALAPILFTPDAVRQGLLRLGAREKETWLVLLRVGGRIEASRLRAQLLRQGVVEPQDAPKTLRVAAVHRTYNVLAPEKSRTDFPTVIGRLMAAGLVCGEGVAAPPPAQGTERTKQALVYYDNVKSLYIPEAIRSLLPEPARLPEPAPAHVPVHAHAAVQALTYVREGSARAFQRDIYLYWSTARIHPLSLTKQGRLYRKDLRLVNAALLQSEALDAADVLNGDDARDEPDLPRLLFLRLLLTDMGLLKRDGQTIQAADRPPFLERTPVERIEQTFAHWRDGTFWNEIWSVPNITIAEAGSRIDPAPKQIVRARQRVLHGLSALHRASDAQAPPEQEGAWTPIEELIDWMRRNDYDFLLPRDDGARMLRTYPISTYQKYLSRPSPYISYGNAMAWSFSPPFYDEAEGWEIVEAGFICALLFEPLHWLGLVDIGLVDGRRVAYRLTPVSAWLLGVGPIVDMPEEQGRVVVQPNFEIYALDPISDRTLSMLDEFAERISAERAIKYRLTRESVYRAQREGWTVARIVETLQQLTQAAPNHDPAGGPQRYPLPQNIVRSLEEWQRLYERVTIHRRGSLLQAVDAELLQQLMDDQAIRPHLAVRSSEAQALGSPENASSRDAASVLISAKLGETEALAHALQEAGYPPARTRFFGGRLRPQPTITPARCIEIAPDGQLRFTIPLPSLYVLEQIAPFTGQDEQDRYFLTQSAVKEAVESGMSVTEILGRLRALHHGPLPRWVEIKVRAWGHYYGDAAVQAVTLVRFRDRETLEELLAEPELQGLLRPFQAARGLALVTVGDPSLLYEVLAERGISLHEVRDADLEVGE